MLFYVRPKCYLYYVFKIETLDVLCFIGCVEDLNSWVCSVLCAWMILCSIFGTKTLDM